jgi:hypothetical protein
MTRFLSGSSSQSPSLARERFAEALYFKVGINRSRRVGFKWVPHVRTSVRGPIMNSSKAFTQRTESYGSASPSFSAHVRWCEHGAPIEVPICVNSGLFLGRLKEMGCRRKADSSPWVGCRPLTSSVEMKICGWFD